MKNRGLSIKHRMACGHCQFSFLPRRNPSVPDGGDGSQMGSPVPQASRCSGLRLSLPRQSRPVAPSALGDRGCTPAGKPHPSRNGHAAARPSLEGAWEKLVGMSDVRALSPPGWKPARSWPIEEPAHGNSAPGRGRRRSRFDTRRTGPWPTVISLLSSPVKRTWNM